MCTQEVHVMIFCSIAHLAYMQHLCCPLLCHYFTFLMFVYCSFLWLGFLSKQNDQLRAEEKWNDKQNTPVNVQQKVITIIILMVIS